MTIFAPSRVLTVSLMMAASTVTACAAPTAEDADKLSESADEAVTANRVNIVGVIGAGDTETVRYAASGGKCLGFTFAGSAGDDVTLHGQAANGAVVRLFVLSATFATSRQSWDILIV